MSSPAKFWEGLLRATGQEQLSEDPRFADRPERIQHQDELIAHFTPIFLTASRDEWCDRLAAAGVPFAPAYDSDEALEDPQAQHLKLKVSAEHPEMGTFTTVRAPYSFDGEAELSVLPPPTLDEHGAEIRESVRRRKVG